MEKKILVVGIEEADALVRMVLKGNKKYLPKTTLVKLPDFSNVRTLKTLKEHQQTFSDKFASVPNKKTMLVVAGSLISPSGCGLAPVFTRDVLNAFRPDLIILLESNVRDKVVMGGYGLIKRKIDITHLRRQQDLNRITAAMLFAPIKIVPFQKANLKKALRELKTIIMDVVKD